LLLIVETTDILYVDIFRNLVQHFFQLERLYLDSAGRLPPFIPSYEQR